MKNFILLYISIFFFFACSSSSPKSKEENNTPIEEKGQQLNISILLDLSDRINPTIDDVSPTHSERDIAIIGNIVKYFKKVMDKQGAYSAKGKLQILFSPEPKESNINILSQKLKVDLSTMDNKQKKAIYDVIEEQFEDNLKSIYDLSIKQERWEGADIWRFFKNNVSDYCVEKDYRNILVILTDGYIYHKNSMDQMANRYAYLTAPLLSKYNLRNNPKWEEEIEKRDFGLITKRNDLNNLEVLLLEISPLKNNPNDEDIIKSVLLKWFNEMGVKKVAIYNTGLPSNTEKNILKFLE